MFVVLIFFLWRIITFFFSFIAQQTIPYLGNFPYRELLSEYRLPSWVSAFANFDGLHYALIAQKGYAQYEQAFFPLYPLLIHALSYLFPIPNAFFAPRNSLLAGLLISNLCFLFGLILLHRLLLLKKYKKLIANWIVFFLVAFPSAFFFGAVYTEGLFFFLVMLSLYKLEKKGYVFAAGAAFFASTTRLAGVFLAIPFVLHFLNGLELVKKRVCFSSRPHVLLLISPFLGLTIYCMYLWIFYGDPLFFINAQPAFNANRSSHVILLPQVYYRYFKIFFTAQHNFQWCLSLFEMTMFTIVFSLLLADLISLVRRKEKPHLSLRLGLNLFSFANLLLPTLTGTFSSIPRYVLFSLSAFVFLGEIHSRLIKMGVLVFFIIVQIILLSFFIQGYFVG